MNKASDFLQDVKGKENKYKMEIGFLNQLFEGLCDKATMPWRECLVQWQIYIVKILDASLGPIFFILFQLSGKFGQIIRWRSWEISDPPLVFYQIEQMYQYSGVYERGFRERFLFCSCKPQVLQYSAQIWKCINHKMRY